MNWEDEPFVKLYTRDTEDLFLIGWEGRFVLWELMRKVDRAGVLDTTIPAVIANMIRVPEEIAAVGLEQLLERGVVVIAELSGRRCLVLPNFRSAQEARQSNKRRQAESRARRRADARWDHRAVEVAGRDGESLSGRNGTSHGVTESHSRLDQTRLDQNPPTPLLGVTPDRDPVTNVIADFNRLFERKFKPSTYADLVRKALKARYTVQQLKAAAWVAQHRYADSPEVLANFTPKSVWRLKSRDGKTTLPEWLDMADELWPQVYPGKPIPWRNAC